MRFWILKLNTHLYIKFQISEHRRQKYIVYCYKKACFETLSSTQPVREQQEQLYSGERSVIHLSLLAEPQAGLLVREWTGHTSSRQHPSSNIPAQELYPVRCSWLNSHSDLRSDLPATLSLSLKLFPAQGQAQLCQQPAAHQPSDQAKPTHVAITRVIGAVGECSDFSKKAHACKLPGARKPCQPKGTDCIQKEYSA